MQLLGTLRLRSPDGEKVLWEQKVDLEQSLSTYAQTQEELRQATLRGYEAKLNSVTLPRFISKSDPQHVIPGQSQFPPLGTLPNQGK